ncbi:MAG: hypothetical protein E7037_02340 [Verrucomicrobia bacterium]|nr:hypothetical protein [Verrucomicrobiota bacterium]
MSAEASKKDWAYAGATISVGGGIIGGLASYFSSRTQAKLLRSQAESQAKITQMNLGKLHRNTGVQLRILEDHRVSAEANTRASIAASGIRQDSQTAQDIFRKQEEEVAREKWSIRQQAIEQSVSMQLESRLNINSLKQQAKAATSAGKMNMATSILGGIGSAAGFMASAA